MYSNLGESGIFILFSWWMTSNRKNVKYDDIAVYKSILIT